MPALLYRLFSSFFFFNDTATTEIYTLSLHDALPILSLAMCVMRLGALRVSRNPGGVSRFQPARIFSFGVRRSEEHTSELQSQSNLVCRLLLEKKKKIHSNSHQTTIHTRVNSHV